MKNRILFYALSLLLMISLMPQMSSGVSQDKINGTITTDQSDAKVLLIYDGSELSNRWSVIIDSINTPVDTIDRTASNSNYDTYINYDVIISSSHNGQSSTSHGNDLADYVDQGGKLIIHPFSFVSGWALQGRINDYFPFYANSNSNQDAVYTVDNNNPLFKGITSVGTSHSMDIQTIPADTEILATYNSGTNDGEPFVGIRGNVIAVNFYPIDMSGEYGRFYDNLLEYAGYGNVEGVNQYEYKFNSQDAKLSLNITIENGTSYDAYLDENLVDTQNYQNGTIDIDISKLYSNYTYTNYTVFNNTKYEYSNLTLSFHTEQNTTYTHFVNVTVFDYLPQVIGDTSVTVNYEIGTSLPLKFNVSDDNPDMVYVYSNNILLYYQNWTDNLDIDVSSFINSSNKLGYNYYNVIFEDMDDNQVQYSLKINVLDTINPIFTSVFADDYIEGDEFGVISFSVNDVTLDRYAVFANDIELANSTFGDTSYIEISNAGLLAGNYEVEIIVYDRANNIAKITTSFVVESQGVTSTVTVDPPVSNSTVTSDTSTNADNTVTIIETTTETNNVTVQGNNTQNVSVPATLPIADLPLMLFTSLIGLYLFRKNRK